MRREAGIPARSETITVAASSGALPFSPPPAASALRDGSVRFDATVVVTALWFIGGLLVDGWAHNHLDLSSEGFFTPYHALFYSGFAAIAVVILTRTYRNRRRGATWQAAIPRGYDVTLAGLAIFAGGGVLDMAWHIVFGIEQDIAALFSPTHLILAAGIAAILSGPIRAVVARRPARSFAAQWPALVSLALFGTVITFFFMWAFGIGAASASAPHLLYPQLTGDALHDASDDRIARGMSAIVFRSLVMVGILLWAARRLRLPAGAATLLIVVPSTLVGAMLDPAPAWMAVQIASALAAGVVADICLVRGLDFSDASWKTRAVAFAMPFVFWAVYVSIAAAMDSGLWWNAHLTAGAPAIGGLVGVLLELVTERHPALETRGI